MVNHERWHHRSNATRGERWQFPPPSTPGHVIKPHPHPTKPISTPTNHPPTTSSVMAVITISEKEEVALTTQRGSMVNHELWHHRGNATRGERWQSPPPSTPGHVIKPHPHPTKPISTQLTTHPPPAA